MQYRGQLGIPTWHPTKHHRLDLSLMQDPIPDRQGHQSKERCLEGLGKWLGAAGSGICGLEEELGDKVTSLSS